MSAIGVKKPRKRIQGPQTGAPHHHEHASITQTNEDLNLSVLRRYWSDITTVIHVTSYAVLYLFSPVLQTWEKVGIEGSLFVVLHLAADVQGQEERFSVVMLNRRGLENFAAPLVAPDDLDVTEQYIIIKESEDIYGLWIFSEPPPSSTAAARETTAHIMIECAKRAQASRKTLLHNLGQESEQDGTTGDEDHQEGAAMTRTKSLMDIVDEQRTQDAAFSLHQHHSPAIPQPIFAKNPDTEFFHSGTTPIKTPHKKPAPAQVNISPPMASHSGGGGMAISLDDLFRQAKKHG
jgi:hypothetical protein